MIKSELEFKNKLVMLESQASSAGWSYRHGNHELKEILVNLDKTLKECLEYMEKKDES